MTRKPKPLFKFASRAHDEARADVQPGELAWGNPCEVYGCVRGPRPERFHRCTDGKVREVCEPHAQDPKLVVP